MAVDGIWDYRPGFTEGYRCIWSKDDERCHGRGMTQPARHIFRECVEEFPLRGHSNPWAERVGDSCH